MNEKKKIVEAAEKRNCQVKNSVYYDIAGHYLVHFVSVLADGVVINFFF